MLQWNEQFYDVLDYFKWQRDKTGDKWPEDCESHPHWPCKFDFFISVELFLFTECLFDILTWSTNVWLGIEIYHYRHHFDSQGLSKMNGTFFIVANQITITSYYSYMYCHTLHRLQILYVINNVLDSIFVSSFNPLSEGLHLPLCCFFNSVHFHLVVIILKNLHFHLSMPKQHGQFSVNEKPRMN